MNPKTARAVEGLREIPLPDAVSYMPQTVGWYILLAILLIAIAVLALRWRRSWVANRYRREALIELVELERTSDCTGLPALIKRTALASSPRESVAALSGAAWLQHLDETEGSRSFTEGVGRLLPKLAYGDPQISDSEKHDLFALCGGWIRRHRARL